MEDDVLTTTEAAKLLGISVRTAQLLIEGGGLPSWKTPGGHRRVHRSDVEALLPDGKPQGRARSATVLVVTSERRRPQFEAVLERIGHLSPQFQTSTWSAAATVAGRLPAVVVVDVEGCGNNAAGLLETLANDVRFQDAALVAVIPSRQRGAAAPASRVCETSLDRLEAVLVKLSEDAGPATGVAGSGFPIAPNEASRLQAVQRSRLVDTPSEAPFDRVTWLAANDLKSPIALMTILTAERQWFKSRQGLEMPDTPRSWAFCNHTVLQRDVLEIRNLAKHESFAGNPAVAGAPHFLFYAGAPVYDADGFALGSICVIDYRPRQLDKTQRKTLLELAAIASDAVKLRGVLAKH
jgi:excisionase family DNA binding protein